MMFSRVARSSTSPSIKKLVQSVGAFEGKETVLKGWIRTVRKQKNMSFVQLNDGTTLHGFQVTLPAGVMSDFKKGELSTGASIEVTGFVCPHPNADQADAGAGMHEKYELEASSVCLIGACDGKYPLQKKQHSLDFLRTLPHLRPRTNTFASLTRIRNAATMGFHNFFQSEDYCYIHTPILTPLDCEGAGELFSVQAGAPRLAEDGKSVQKDNFFGRQCYLTVSGQLYAEMCATALRTVYTFGPTFRAEQSHTSHHLAEFWMLEPEIAFADLSDAMDVCEQSIRATTRSVLHQCPDELEFLSERRPGHEADPPPEHSLLERLQAIVDTDFARVTYTQALEDLAASGHAFDNGVPAWGDDLNREHERYLAEVMYRRPVFVIQYPKSLKPFYMRETDGADPARPTVECMDLLVGGIGELAGGSQREERLPELRAAMKEHKLRTSHYQWYLDLRRYGTVPHAGFGIGFERYLQLITGMGNVRDLVAVPRAAGLADI